MLQYIRWMLNRKLPRLRFAARMGADACYQAPQPSGFARRRGVRALRTDIAWIPKDAWHAIIIRCRLLLINTDTPQRPAPGYTGGMFRNPIVPWVLAVFGITMAVLFSVRADRASDRAETADAMLRNRVMLETQGEDMESGTFVNIEDLKLTYKVLVQIDLDGKTYTDRVAKTTTVDPEVRVAGVAGTTGLEALKKLPEGTSIRFRSTPDESGNLRIITVVALP